jgi:hypothetical protein
MSDKTIDFDRHTIKFNSPVDLNTDQDAQLIISGYEPLPVLGKIPAAKGWSSGVITAQRLANERVAHAGARSTGLRTGRLAAVDIDVIKEEHVEQIVRLAKRELGETPLMRFGAKGRMLLYRNETPIYKITIGSPKKEKVEIMGYGQQIVAYGVHPDTGQPYRWLGGDDTHVAADPLYMPLTELPEVTPDTLRAFAHKAACLLTELGYGTTKITGDIANENMRGVSSASGYPVTAALIRSAASYLDPGVPRDKWIRWIAGLRSAPLVGDDALHIRRQIAHEFSSGDLDRLKRGEPQNYQGSDDVDRVFDSMPPKEGGATIGTLFRDARSAGWKGNPFGAKSAAGAFCFPMIANASESCQQFPDLTKNGTPRATLENTRLAVEALGVVCSHDTFHDKMLLGGHTIAQWAGELSDNACLMMRNVIRKEYDFEPSALTMIDAARQLCLRNPFDPVCNYLDGLKWDGIKRVDSWLIDYLGAPNTEFVRAVGRCVLRAAVRRARVPGTKFDQITVLEGPEGRNKSTAVKIMAGEENFSDQSILTENDKTQQELLKGVWLYEIADLTGISKADVDRVKAFASRTHDRARPAYGRVVVNQPRRCVMFATTNNDTYLQSQTGNRRFWPIKTGRIDIEKLKADRDQLWAEAASQEAADVSIMLPEKLWPIAAKEQAERLHADPWTDKLANIVGEIAPDPDGIGRVERISSNDLIELELKIPADRANSATFTRLKHVMNYLGWQGPEQLRIGGAKVRGYSRWLPE